MNVIGYVCVGNRRIEVFSTTCHKEEVDDICEQAKISCYSSRIHKQNNGRAWIEVDAIADDGTVKTL